MKFSRFSSMLFTIFLVMPFPSIIAGSGGIVHKELEARMRSMDALKVTQDLMDELDQNPTIAEFRELSTTIDPDNGLRIKLYKSVLTGRIKMLEEVN